MHAQTKSPPIPASAPAAVTSAARASAIVALLKGTAEAKETAEWDALRDVVQSLDTVRPRSLAFPAMLQGVSVSQLREALVLEAEERPPYAHIFSAFRAEVWRLEARNASRLGVLVGALRRIAHLRERGFDAATLHGFEQALRGHLKRAWSLELPKLESETEWREWPLAATRRYDLLPRAWREL